MQTYYLEFYQQVESNRIDNNNISTKKRSRDEQTDSIDKRETKKVANITSDNKDNN